MRRCGVLVCVAFLVTSAAVQAVGELDRAEVVRTAMTVVGAAGGLAVGAFIGISFSGDATDTPLSNALVLTIPVAAVGAATAALAARWIADVALRAEPGPLLAVLEGAGLGLLGGAFVGGIVFPLNFAIAHRVLEVPEGYWGRFDSTQAVGMGVVSGAFWGGLFGAVAGALVVPLISLYMGY